MFIRLLKSITILITVSILFFPRTTIAEPYEMTLEFIQLGLAQWTLDPSQNGLELSEAILDADGDFITTTTDQRTDAFDGMFFNSTDGEPLYNPLWYGDVPSLSGQKNELTIKAATAGTVIIYPELTQKEYDGVASFNPTDISFIKSYAFFKNHNVARGYLRLINNGTSAKTISINSYNNYGSDGATLIETSSSGDDTVSTIDAWFISSDRISTADPSDPASYEDPVVTTVFASPQGFPASATLSMTGFGLGDGEGEYIFDVTIEPGESIGIIMFFMINSTVDEAQEQVDLLFNTKNLTDGAGFFCDLTEEELSSIANWPDLIGCKTISGVTWIDLNSDGIKNPDESSLGGVEVKLVSEDFLTEIATTTTDPTTGEYSFEGIPLGEYSIRFTNPDSALYTLTTGDVGSDDNADSDVIADGKAIFIVNETSDFGLISAGFLPTKVTSDLSEDEIEDTVSTESTTPEETSDASTTDPTTEDSESAASTSNASTILAANGCSLYPHSTTSRTSINIWLVMTVLSALTAARIRSWLLSRTQ